MSDCYYTDGRQVEDHDKVVYETVSGDVCVGTISCCGDRVSIVFYTGPTSESPSQGIYFHEAKAVFHAEFALMSAKEVEQGPMAYFNDDW